MSLEDLLRKLGEKNIEIWEEKGHVRFRAPKGALNDGLRDSILANKQELIDYLRRPIRSPLSFSQMRIWIADQLAPEAHLYNVSEALRLRGKLNVTALERSLNEIVRRHGILRTTFVFEGEKPEQILHPAVELKLAMTDYSSLAESERLNKALSAIGMDATRLYDLHTGPVFRPQLFRLSDDDHIFLLDYHHIVVDAWSALVIIDEIGILYRAFSEEKIPPLSNITTSYLDYVASQQETLNTKDMELNHSYWEKRLQGASSVLDLPIDRTRPDIPSGNTNSYRFKIEGKAFENIKEIAKNNKSTLYITLLTNLAIMLHTITGQDDLVIGAPTSNRDQIGFEKLVGPMINTNLFRIELDNSEGFGTMLARVREDILKDYDHQNIPFEEVIQYLDVPNKMFNQPIIQVLFNYHNFPFKIDMDWGEVKAEYQEIPFDNNPFDLHFKIRNGDKQFEFEVIYDEDLFDHATVMKIGKSFHDIFEKMINAPEVSIMDLVEENKWEKNLSKEELNEMLYEWNATDASFPADKTVYALFEEQAALTPNAAALFHGDEMMTFEQLNAKANRLAHYLSGLGIGVGDFVAVSLPRSADAIVALIAVMKTGAAYLPLDTSYPTERLVYMLMDSGARTLLTNKNEQNKFDGVDVQIILLDAGEEKFKKGSSKNLVMDIGANEAAYILYTSGSTGKPKGVVGLHIGAVNRFAWMWKHYPFQEGEVCCHKTALNFVDSVWEIFGPLLKGIPLQIIEDEELHNIPKFISLLESKEITRIVLVPSFLAVMLQYKGNLAKRLAKLTTWTVSGETLSKNLWSKFTQRLPAKTLLNLYGSTEVAGDATWMEISGDSKFTHDSIPIGQPIANMKTYILDNKLDPVKVGKEGELYVSGPGLAREYWNDREKTAARFVENPFVSGSHKMFGTGDRARYLPTGQIEFLGRRDSQVKINGVRVELGEVEACLQEHDDVRQAIILLKRRTTGDELLAAYVLLEEYAGLNVEQLRSYLRGHLPGYMLPGEIYVLEHLPLLPNGKVDRQELLSLKILGGGDEHDEWLDQLEIELSKIWEKVLDVKNIGRKQDFFALGGGSMIAIRLFLEIKNKFAVNLSPTSLINSNTIEMQADMIRGGELEKRWEAMVAVQPKGNGKPIFCFAGVGGVPLRFRRLSELIGNSNPVYFMQSRGLSSADEMQESVEEIAADYTREIKKKYPQGPYILIGSSFGGNVAYELGRQLELEGELGNLVVMLDTRRPVFLMKDKITIEWKKQLYQLLEFIKKHFHNIFLSNLKDRKLYFEYYRDYLPMYIRAVWVRFGVKIHRKNNDDVPVEFNLVRNANLKASLKYEPGKYNGEVILIRTTKQPKWYKNDLLLGWGHVKVDIEVHSIKGYHGNILFDPAISDVYQIIKDKLI